MDKKKNGLTIFLSKTMTVQCSPSIIFLGMIKGRISAPSQSKYEQKTSQNGVYHYQFLSSTFRWKFTIKNGKVTDT